MDSKSKKYIPPEELKREILTVIIFSLAINILTSIEFKFFYFLSFVLVSLSSYYIFLYTRIDTEERDAINNTLLFEKTLFSTTPSPEEEKTEENLFVRWILRRRELTEERFEKHENNMKILWNKAIVTCVLGIICLFVNQSPYGQAENQQESKFFILEKKIEQIDNKIDSSDNKANLTEQTLAYLYSLNLSNIESLREMRDEMVVVLGRIENKLGEVNKKCAEAELMLK